MLSLINKVINKYKSDINVMQTRVWQFKMKNKHLYKSYWERGRDFFVYLFIEYKIKYFPVFLVFGFYHSRYWK